MRKWIKYSLDREHVGTRRVDHDRSFDDHKLAMGGYHPDESYVSREEFFRKYFYGFQVGRLEFSNDFLRRSLSKHERVLSIGSGRCASELHLMEDGYDITCSDLDYFEAYAATKSLFPSFRFLPLDFLCEPAPETYDAVVAVGLISLFDNDDLVKFLQNVAHTLRPGGHLILDSSGSPDNLMSFLLHDVWLNAETRLKRHVKFLLTGHRPGLIIKHHGYRRSEDDIVSAANHTGLQLVDKGNYAFTFEFKRSWTLSRMMRSNRLIEQLFRSIGQRIPFVRMFKFRKRLREGVIAPPAMPENV